jgi:hypothetical protein
MKNKLRLERTNNKETTSGIVKGIKVILQQCHTLHRYLRVQGEKQNL